VYNQTHHLALIILTLFFTGCGPVQSRIHTSPVYEAAQQNMQQTMREETARRAKANTFTYHPETKDCRNAQGLKGYNSGSFSPCSLITDINLIPQSNQSTVGQIDLKGSVFFNLNLEKNTSFQGADLTDTTWVNVTGIHINFDEAEMNRVQFHHCKITDQHGKPVQ
jgi:uncharacterized protein YjbI with pentapeptide repeats